MIENGPGAHLELQSRHQWSLGPCLPHIPPPPPPSYIHTLDGYWLCVGCCPQAGDRYSPDGDTFRSIIHSTASMSTYCAPGSTSGAGGTAMNTVGRVWPSWRLSSSGKADSNDTCDSGKGMKSGQGASLEWSGVPSKIGPVSSQPLHSFSPPTSSGVSALFQALGLDPGLQT